MLGGLADEQNWEILPTQRRICKWEKNYLYGDVSSENLNDAVV